MDLRAEVVGSESRMRDSWAMRDVRWSGGLVGLYFAVDLMFGCGIGGCEPCASGLYGMEERRTFSRISLSCSSVFCSSSLGFGSASDLAANCAYVWNSDSV